jgi:hypothetical protein
MAMTSPMLDVPFGGFEWVARHDWRELTADLSGSVFECGF